MSAERTHGPMEQQNRLYVGNLPYDIIEDEDLGAIFTDLGFKVARPRIIKDRDTGRSKGFGFVEILPPEQTNDAIRVSNEHMIGGRPLKVSVAKPKEPGAGGGGGGGGGGGNAWSGGGGGGGGSGNRGGGGGGYQAQDNDRKGGGRGGRDRDRDGGDRGRW